MKNLQKRSALIFHRLCVMIQIQKNTLITAKNTQAREEKLIFPSIFYSLTVDI